MTDMTTNERMKLTYAHREADRAPIIDLPWESTIARWRNEGLPPGADWGEFFDVDCVRRLLFDVSPRYPVRIVAADDESRTYTTGWGATKKDWLTTGAQGYLNYTITSKDEWLKARQRMSASRDRVPWDSWNQTTIAGANGATGSAAASGSALKWSIHTCRARPSFSP